MFPTLRPLPPRRRSVPRRIGGRRRREDALAWLCFGAASFAAAEIALTLLIGRFFDWGRAEALLFFAFRPWLLLVSAIRVGNWDWPFRYAFYVLALLAAGLSESLLLVSMGATNPWPEMVRGLAGGAVLALIFDLFSRSGGQVAGRLGRLTATILLAILMLVPGTLDWHDRLLLGPPPAEVSTRPAVLVMTSLPLIWGEGGAFAPGAGPSASWQLLGEEFEFLPIDAIEDPVLDRARLMLLAQPRQLSPAELVAIDSWVRKGGRMLILADPALNWPSQLPAGDVNRPISTNMLTPLLDHWGISFSEAVSDPHISMVAGRRLWVWGTSALSSANPACRREAFFILDCAVGRGRAIIVADSDLLHDSLSWRAGSPSRRAFRLSDNVLAVADRLDRLAGLERQRRAGEVQWVTIRDGHRAGLLVAFLPILFLLGLALTFPRLGGNSLTYPQVAE